MAKSVETSLRSWLWTTSLLVLVFMVALTSLILGTTNVLNDAVAAMGRDLEGANIAGEVRAELLNQLRLTNLRNVLDPEHYAVLRDASNERLQVLIKNARSHVGSHREGELLAQVEVGLENYMAERDRLEQSGASNDAVLRTLLPRLDSILLNVSGLQEINAEQAARTTAEAGRVNRVANVAAVLAFVVSCLAVALALTFTYRQVSRPLVELRTAIGKLRSGEAATRSTEEGASEIRDVSRAFNELSETLERKKAAQLAELAGIAHDLGNSLVGFKLLLPALHPPDPDPDPESDRIRRTLALFDRQLHQATNITANLLESARGEAGYLELRPARVDMGRVAREAVELAGAAHPSHRVELAQPSEPIEVGADAVRLQQVLDNLLQNAIKYSPEGSRVRVTLSADDREAAISVADEGAGIPPEDLPLLFTPFYRSKSAAGAPGAGLGLSVAQRIVLAHGGRIDVQSRPGSGSTFTVVLPRTADLPALEPRSRPRIPYPTPGLTEASPRRRGRSRRRRRRAATARRGARRPPRPSPPCAPCAGRPTR